MDPDRWRRINDIFQNTIEQGAEARRDFLVQICAGDVRLHEEVTRLVRAHERAAGFLAQPAVADARRILALDDWSARGVHEGAAGQIEAEFRGTERFKVLRRLGAGGMGVVYAVRDVVRDEVVALKTLRRARPVDVSRLKREFRSLADVAHPNLVCLHELVVEATHCFFTMELVEGASVTAYLQPPISDAIGSGMVKHRPDPERVRSILRQVVAGLSALHEKGKLHRDIKPSNVMVRRDGRVVILDFGLAIDVPTRAGVSDERMAGTPAYLAPEQHAGAAPSEASDWYAVGVTLYEAMTGRLPFSGSWQTLSARKRHSDPPPPASIEAAVPDDLNEICLGLLCRDPGRRLSGREALGRLADRATRYQKRLSSACRSKPLFAGRARHLAILDASLAAVNDGRPATVCIHGTSGIGKTALVQHYLEQLPHGVVVLRGRCYQHESVAYEALDGIIDSLSAYLRALPPAEAAALVPPGSGVLGRAFPVMLQVEAVARAAHLGMENPEPSTQRRQAFSVLRELLTRIAQRHTLVLFIDDLHWADADSMLLLEAVLRPPDPPPVLMLACLRTEEIASKPFLQAFLHGGATRSRSALLLEPMTEDESLDALASMIPAGAEIDQAVRIALAREAGGNPFLLEQLAHYADGNSAGASCEATLADMLQHRLRDSPDGARQFLEVLAVCARPMPQDVIRDAAGLSGDERPLVAILRSAHLLRHSGCVSRIEMYHERLRETLTTQLSPDRTRRIHHRLLRTLTTRGLDDPEVLFEHCRGAGDHEGAARQAALAATRANAVLAFDRAVFFYRSALELMPHAAAVAEWKQGLAEALTNAGRSPEAGEVYLDASIGAQGWQQVDLQRRAAEQLLIGGHIDRGMTVIRTVLRALRMRLSPGPLTAFASLSWRRARIRRRGLAFVRRDEDHIPADSLLRIDTCWSVTTGLLMVDSIRAADFNARHLLLALDAGEPYRIARAVALEAGFLASSGMPLHDVSAWVAQAASLATQSGRPHAVALSSLTAGMSAFLAGEWPRASLLCERALVALRDCPGAVWETNCAESFLLYSRLYTGAIGEVSRRLPALLTAARDRGNRYFETELRTRMNVIWLAADQPDEGLRQADEAMDGWSHEGFHRQHYSHVLAHIQTELYRGNADAAWHHVARHWAAFERMPLLRVPYLRIEASYLRARAALLSASRGRDVARFLSIARKDAERIRRFRNGWSDAIATLIDAAVAQLERRSGDARDLLAAAVTAFERANMRFHAAVARRQLGSVQGDDRGRGLVDAADGWMAGQDIRSPERMARLIAPGFPESAAFVPSKNGGT
jgi:eukaryotic-like serine/threonine-protein kinase